MLYIIEEPSFIFKMNLHVSIHCDSCAGWIATKFTIVWYLSTVGQSETLDWPQEYGFLSSVSEDMISQNLIRTENFVALQALVQLFPNVYHLVLLQVPSLIEPFVAMMAVVRFLSRVSQCRVKIGKVNIR